MSARQLQEDADFDNAKVLKEKIYLTKQRFKLDKCSCIPKTAVPFPMTAFTVGPQHAAGLLSWYEQIYDY